MIKTLEAVKARKQFGTMLDEVFYKGDVITIERKGKPMAALVPLGFLEARQYATQRITEIAEENERQNKGSQDELQREIESAIIETRKNAK